MKIEFRPATRRRARLRLLLDALSKGGKTLTALILARLLGKRRLLLEAGESTGDLYAGSVFDGEPLTFDVGQLSSTGADDYTVAINQASAAGYDVIVIDSLTPAWAGPGGVLELHDRIGSKNSFADWLKVNPIHARMFAAIRDYPGHVICTVRSKTEWEVSTSATGKKEMTKIGTAPQQRPNIEYEFDLLGTLDQDHNIKITGSRCPSFDGASGHKPGKAFWLPLLSWLETGEVVAPAVRVPLISDAQMAEIGQLRIQLGMTDKLFWAMISRQWSTTTLGTLTAEQAAACVGQLRTELARKSAAQAADSPPTPKPSAPAPSPDGAATATLQEALAAMPGAPVANGVAKPAERSNPVAYLLEMRDSYFSLCGLGDNADPDVAMRRKTAWEAILAKRGVRPLDQPPPEVVLELTASLAKKVDEMVDARRNSGATCTTRSVDPLKQNSKESSASAGGAKSQ